MASPKLPRNAKTSRFSVSPKASAAIAAVEGLRLDADSRARLAAIRHLSPEAQRKAIRAAYVKKG